MGDYIDELDMRAARDRELYREIGKTFEQIHELTAQANDLEKKKNELYQRTKTLYLEKMENERRYREKLEARTPHATPIADHNSTTSARPKFAEHPAQAKRQSEKKRAYDSRGPEKTRDFCVELFNLGHRYVSVEMVVERFECSDDAARERLRTIMRDKMLPSQYAVEWLTKPSIHIHRIDEARATAQVSEEPLFAQRL